jgi:hypothetical protein
MTEKGGCYEPEEEEIVGVMRGVMDGKSKAGKMSRRKGACGEKEFARLVEDLLGVRLSRNLSQSRDGGHDMTHKAEAAGVPAARALARYAIEVKRRHQAAPSDLSAWWSQAVGQADRCGLWPALAYREDRREWRVVIPLSSINPEMTLNLGLEYAASLSLEGFCSVVRES